MSNVTNFDGPVWIGRLASDPASPLDGQMWYNTADDEFKFRQNGITEILATPTSSQPKYAFLSDVKSSATDGGTFTAGSYVTRVLNTEVDPDGIVTLASNQFTLDAGTYIILAKAPAYSLNTAGIFQHKAKLRNITDSTDELIGTSEAIRFDSASGSAGQTSSIVYGMFTIAGTKTFELQHRCGETETTSGLGKASSFGDSEVFATVAITMLP